MAQRSKLQAVHLVAAKLEHESGLKWVGLIRVARVEFACRILFFGDRFSPELT
jgi:hypothetical protein